MVFFSPNGLPLQNPYTLLSLPQPPASISDDEINKGFKKLMLQLHPDKQPLNQSPEEAEVINIKLHDVMDAKSFLLDGEYVTARREYDSLLIKNSGSATPQTQSSSPAVPSSTVPKPEKQSQQQGGGLSIEELEGYQDLGEEPTDSAIEQQLNEKFEQETNRVLDESDHGNPPSLETRKQDTPSEEYSKDGEDWKAYWEDD